MHKASRAFLHGRPPEQTARAWPAAPLFDLACFCLAAAFLGHCVVALLPASLLPLSLWLFVCLPRVDELQLTVRREPKPQGAGLVGSSSSTWRRESSAAGFEPPTTTQASPLKRSFRATRGSNNSYRSTGPDNIHSRHTRDTCGSFFWLEPPPTAPHDTMDWDRRSCDGAGMSAVVPAAWDLDAEATADSRSLPGMLRDWPQPELRTVNAT